MSSKFCLSDSCVVIFSYFFAKLLMLVKCLRVVCNIDAGEYGRDSSGQYLSNMIGLRCSKLDIYYFVIDLEHYFDITALINYEK